MGRLGRRFVGFVLAFIVTFLLASFSHTSFVLLGLADIGVEFSTTSALRMYFSDVVGMIPSYGMALACALLTGFVSSSILRHRLNRSGRFSLGRWVFAVVGGLAVLVVLAAFALFFDGSLLAGARGWLGLLCQIVAGVLGGLIYIRTVSALRHKRKRRYKKVQRRMASE